MIDWQDFGIRVSKKIQRRDSSLREVAKATGIDKSALWRASNGKSCSADNYLRICAELRIPAFASYVHSAGVRALASGGQA